VRLGGGSLAGYGTHAGQGNEAEAHLKQWRAGGVVGAAWHGKAHQQ
jgi:hypothetical protein